MSLVGRVQGVAVPQVPAAQIQRQTAVPPVAPLVQRPIPPQAPKTGPLSKDRVNIENGNNKAIPANISLFGTGDLAPVVDHVLGPKTAKPEAPKAPQKPGFLKLFG